MKKMSEFNKIKYNNQFNREKYDRINIMLPKGYKTALKEHTAKTHESVNAFVKRAIDRQISDDMCN